MNIASEASRSYAAAQEKAIVDQIGFIMRGTTKVVIRPPRWMPNRLYLWLLRQIVLEVTPMTIEKL